MVYQAATGLELGRPGHCGGHPGELPGGHRPRAIWGYGPGDHHRHNLVPDPLARDEIQSVNLIWNTGNLIDDEYHGKCLHCREKTAGRGELHGGEKSYPSSRSARKSSSHSRQSLPYKAVATRPTRMSHPCLALRSISVGLSGSSG